MSEPTTAPPVSPPEAEPLGSVTLIFNADGTIGLQAAGIAANQAWAAAGLLRNLGDDMWHQSQAEKAARAAAMDPRRRLVTPQS